MSDSGARGAKPRETARGGAKPRGSSRRRALDKLADTLPLDLPGDGGTGRVERAVAAAIRAAQRAGTLDPTHAGLGATLRALGRALDTAERKGDPYAAAQAGRVLLDALDRARLTPTATGSAADAAPSLADLLARGSTYRSDTGTAG